MTRGVSRFACVLPLLLLAAACSNDASEDVGDDEGALSPLDPEKDDAVSRNRWQSVGEGVSYKAFDGGRNVLLVYGGYSAQDVYVQRWSDELFRVKGAPLGLGHVYAVRGPNQAAYANHEIANSRLAAHLADGRAAGAASLVVVAHSSGTYVADELFEILREGQDAVPADTLGKVTFFNLDGGATGAGTLGAMAGAYFVFACDGTIDRCSHNSSSMRSFGSTYASLGGPISIRADGSGCSTSSGGLWCMHDTLINTRPHNPLSYDLRRDYTDFAGTRSVVSSYLDVLER